MRNLITLVLLIISAGLYSQTPKIDVLTLGTFHFGFQNLDTKQIDKSKQINVLENKYQREINAIVNKLYKFRPTVVALEINPSEQLKTDSLYNEYLQGRYDLGKSESEQIGFRLARMMGLKKVYCVNAWGEFNENIKNVISGKDSNEFQKFSTYFKKNPDSLKLFRPKEIWKSKGILESLKQLNNEQNIKKTLGNYLIGHFKYESEFYDFKGVDFESGRWFNRNLRIFRNIQRVETNPSDKILVIFGAGHMNLLNYFFDCSPEYHRVKTNDYL